MDPDHKTVALIGETAVAAPTGAAKDTVLIEIYRVAGKAYAVLGRVGFLDLLKQRKYAFFCHNRDIPFLICCFFNIL